MYSTHDIANIRPSNERVKTKEQSNHSTIDEQASLDEYWLDAILFKIHTEIWKITAQVKKSNVSEMVRLQCTSA